MRYVLIHAPSGQFEESAHAFGPFTSEEEAEAFDQEAPDSCEKWLVPIVGPDIADIAATMEVPRLTLLS